MNLPTNEALVVDITAKVILKEGDMVLAGIICVVDGAGNVLPMDNSLYQFWPLINTKIYEKNGIVLIKRNMQQLEPKIKPEPTTEIEYHESHPEFYQREPVE